MITDHHFSEIIFQDAKPMTTTMRLEADLKKLAMAGASGGSGSELGRLQTRVPRPRLLGGAGDGYGLMVNGFYPMVNGC